MRWLLLKWQIDCAGGDDKWKEALSKVGNFRRGWCDFDVHHEHLQLSAGIRKRSPYCSIMHPTLNSISARSNLYTYITIAARELTYRKLQIPLHYPVYLCRGITAFVEPWSRMVVIPCEMISSSGDARASKQSLQRCLRTTINCVYYTFPSGNYQAHTFGYQISTPN